MQTSELNQGKFSIWPIIILSLLGLNMTICAITVYAATRNPASVSVEPDYYRKAVEWDAQRQIWSTPDELGWVVEASTRVEEGRALVDMSITGRTAEVGLRAQAFHRLRPDVRTEIMLVRTDIDGQTSTYTGVLPEYRTGIWELQVRDDSQHVRFVRTVELIEPLTGS